MFKASPLPLGVSLELEVHFLMDLDRSMKKKAVAGRVDLKGDLELATSTSPKV